MLRRRTAVYVALSENVGHDLVFRHYTNKVVVGKYLTELKISKPSNQAKKLRGEKKDIN